MTPFFSRGRLHASAIDSVLAHDYPELQYLVVAAASTDETLDALARFLTGVRRIFELDRG